MIYHKVSDSLCRVSGSNASFLTREFWIVLSLKFVQNPIYFSGQPCPIYLFVRNDNRQPRINKPFCISALMIIRSMWQGYENCRYP